MNLLCERRLKAQRFALAGDQHNGAAHRVLRRLDRAPTWFTHPHWLPAGGHSNPQELEAARQILNPAQPL